MLSNNLTLDEEDAVQAELRELQDNIVRSTWLLGIFNLIFVKLREAQPFHDLDLPTAPTAEPVSEEQTPIERQKVPVAS